MRTTIGFLTIAFTLATAACTTKTNRVVIDDDKGAGGAGAGNNSGGMGSGGSNTDWGEGCDGLCAKVADAGCANDSEASCKTECDGLYGMTPANCTADLDAFVACQIDGEISCDGGDAKVSGCDSQAGAYFACLQGGGGGGACYANHGACNPLEAGSCGAGEACDVGQDGSFVCFPPPNNAPIGGSCDPSNGPWCAHGGVCVDGACAAFCCETSDCVSGTCQTIGSAGAIELKACGA